MLSVGPAYIFVSPSASVPPLRLSDATVTFTCWHLAWGLLLWSRATAVCSHPLNFIYPNLRSSLETLLATGHRGQNQNTQTHTFTLPSLWSTVVCISPWKQPVQHRSHTAVHWFTASFCFELVVGFGSAFLNWKCRTETIHTTPSANIYPFLITNSLGY